MKLFDKQNAVVRGGLLRARQPFDFGIKGFKRLLKENKSLTSHEKNRAVRLYKQRINERLREIKETLDKEIEVDNDSK